VAAFSLVLLAVNAEHLDMEDQPDRGRLERIGEEIDRMFEEDQDAPRMKLDTWLDVVRRNSARMRESVAEIGWPTIPMGGR
jgi:hypothetical protein